MKAILEKLFAGARLSREEARAAMDKLISPDVSPAQIASILTFFRSRLVTPPELLGFRDSLLGQMKSVNLGTNDTVDLCGTGGDGKNTFNISTVAAFVVAAAGAKVAKHGNYGSSSSCGSSNLLEALGIKFSADESKLRKSLDQAGICFFHAPLFHPGLKQVATVRKELGFRTVFNVLGPLLHPAAPAHFVTGVANLEILRLYRAVYEELGKSYTLLHSHDGYDEISLTGSFRLATENGDFELSPEDIALPRYSPQSLNAGGNTEEAVTVCRDILESRGTAGQKDVVVANAAAALFAAKKCSTLSEGIGIARLALESGRAAEALKKAIEFSA